MHNPRRVPASGVDQRRFIRSWSWLAAAVATVLTAMPVVSADGDSRWVWPLSPPPTVVRGYDAPDPDWQPGHRGVDLAGQVGDPVLAIGRGRVSFAGRIAGLSIVVVGHGALRSTYQPVLPQVRVGARVGAGDRIGTLEVTGSHCLPAACLHLGLRRGEAYLDPLSLYGPRPVRLLPLGSLPPSPLQTSHLPHTPRPPSPPSPSPRPPSPPSPWPLPPSLSSPPPTPAASPAGGGLGTAMGLLVHLAHSPRASGSVGGGGSGAGMRLLVHEAQPLR
jgi:murein DD-endopeptidase MepM/ murein hydrolase activator NlpD